MSQNLSGFTDKTKEKIGDVLGEEEYVRPIANSLGKKWIESFKKFMSPQKLTRVIKKVNIGFLGIEFRNPAEYEQAINIKKASEPEFEH